MSLKVEIRLQMALQKALGGNTVYSNWLNFNKTKNIILTGRKILKAQSIMIAARQLKTLPFKSQSGQINPNKVTNIRLKSHFDRVSIR